MAAPSEGQARAAKVRGPAAGSHLERHLERSTSSVRLFFLLIVLVTTLLLRLGQSQATIISLGLSNEGDDALGQDFGFAGSNWTLGALQARQLVVPTLTAITLIPASHPAAILPTRWNLAAPTALDFTPVLALPLDQTSLASYGASTFNCKAAVRLRFVGSRTAHLHTADPGVANVMFYYQFDGGPWLRGRAEGHFGLLAMDLNPSRVYTVLVIFDDFCGPPGLRFLGIGLDAPSADPLDPRPLPLYIGGQGDVPPTPSTPVPLKQAVPGLPILELVGDSISAIRHFAPPDPQPRNGGMLEKFIGVKRAAQLRRRFPQHMRPVRLDLGAPGQIGSISFSACETAACHPATVAKPGMELIDYPFNTVWTPGMEYSYFQQWFPTLPDRRTHPGRFDFASQRGYTPRVIVINIGINDRARGHAPPTVLPRKFQTSMITLIRGMRRVHGREARIVVMVPPGYVRLYIPPETTKTRPRTTTKAVTTTRGPNKSTTTVVPTPHWIVRPPFEVATVYAAVVDRLRRQGDRNVFLLNTTGWLNNGNVDRMMMDAVHPNFGGARMFGLRLGEWLVSQGILQRR
jgi:lysophospholipase L1-like esterase